MTFITDSIAIGDSFEAERRTVREAAGIHSVLCLDGQWSRCKPGDFGLAALTCIDLRDGKGNPPKEFDRAVRAVERHSIHHPNLLVICHSGRSRSVMVVAAYLVRRYDWSLWHSLTFIQSRRPEICSPDYLISVWDVNNEGRIV